MRRPARMNVDRCSQFSETVRGASMIEMNVTQKYVLHIGRFDPCLPQAGHHVLECGFGASIEQNDTVVCFQRGSGNDSAVAELPGIDDVQVQSELHKTETSYMQSRNPPKPVCRNIQLRTRGLRMLFAAEVAYMNSSISPVNRLVTRLPAVLLLIFLFVRPADCAAASDQARVTKIVREVKLIPKGAKAEPAELNAQVNSDTGVRTGDRSRSELTFTDLTIERLGSNTVFHFNKAGRVVDLEGGSMLLRIPKNSGGAQMQTRAVTVGVSGTTLILETTSAGRNKLIVLEGSARLALRRYPRESVNLRGGQMEDVPAGATKLPPPVNIDVNDVMKKHPLITDFPPLPSKDLIYANAPDRPVQGQPVGGGPAVIPTVIGPLLGGGGLVIGPGPIGGGTGRGTRGTRGRPPGNRDGTGKPTGSVNSDSAPLQSVAPGSPKRTPSKSTPKRKPKGT